MNLESAECESAAADGAQAHRRGRALTGDPDSPPAPASAVDDGPTRLEVALAAACNIAIDHGFAEALTPADFAIQRSPAGATHAAWVGATHVVSVVINEHAQPAFGLAELDWLHFPDPQEPFEACLQCLRPRTIDTVHLPGDAPAEVSAG